MRLGHIPLLAAAGMLCACGHSGQDQSNAAAGDNSAAPVAPAPPPPLPSDAPPPPPATPLPPAASAAANAVEANNAAADAAPEEAAADAKSAAAATALAQRFIDLLNHRQFGEAYMLLGSSAPARSDFDGQFAKYSDLHVAMGTPGEPEGAAGSSYLSVPAKLSGSLDGKKASRPITIVLRRVNDVPGSTEAQRRWHIERVDAG